MEAILEEYPSQTQDEICIRSYSTSNSTSLKIIADNSKKEIACQHKQRVLLHYVVTDNEKYKD